MVASSYGHKRKHVRVYLRHAYFHRLRRCAVTALRLVLGRPTQALLAQYSRLMGDGRFPAAMIALGLSAVLAVVLILLSATDSAWLGWAAFGLVFVVLAVRFVAVEGLRGALAWLIGIGAVILLAVVAQRIFG